MKIVKFKNGKFGARKGIWFNGYKFLVLNESGKFLGEFVVGTGNIIKYAQGTLEEVKQGIIHSDDAGSVWKG